MNLFAFKDVRFRNILNVPLLQIEEGKITTLVGPSGCGKTTLLRLLNKLISPTQGTIYYKEQKLNDIDAVSHRRDVTMLSQTPTVFDGTVRDNLLVGLRYQDRPEPDDEQLRAVLKQVNLHKELEDSTERMSGGELQRMALGRVLLLDSPVYLMDEPSSSLDESMEDAIFDMISDHVRKKHKALIMVTHSSRVARTYSDQIITIADGRCIKENNE